MIEALRPEWWDDALCRGIGPDLFFGPPLDEGETVTARRKRERQAKDICYQCVVQVECLADALKYADDGVRGGLTRHERQSIAPTQAHMTRWVPMSTGQDGDAVLERQNPTATSPTAQFRVIENGKVIFQSIDETDAWITLHRTNK